MTPRDTIAAIATAPGRAAIGIVRVSGPGVSHVIEAVVGRPLHPRVVSRSEFRDAQGVPIDQGIALYFPAPHSYTGEDVLELQGHGGPVIMRILLQRCLEAGARMAQPGEFTQRAFLGGKMDLAQAESVIDMIDATTAQGARSAMRSLRGDFSKQIQSLTASLTELRARVEATLDFPDEEVDTLDTADARKRLEAVRSDLTAVLDAARQGSLLREGLHVVLAGRPNVGKSSLLNRLAGEDLAIVTDVPGTTRDTVREFIDIAGIPLHIIDTAGLRESADPVERAGIARTWSAIDRADAVLQVVDATAGMTAADRAIAAKLPERLPRVRIMNKIDVIGRAPAVDHASDETIVWLSALTGAGIEQLRGEMLRLVGWHGDPETVFSARERHLVALRRAQDMIERAGDAVEQLELFAEDLRLAQRELSSITGEFTADDLLGEIFSRFCIGK